MELYAISLEFCNSIFHWYTLKPALRYLKSVICLFACFFLQTLYLRIKFEKLLYNFILLLNIE